MLEDRRVVRATAAAPGVRKGRLLRRLPEPPRHGALPRDEPPDRALGGAGRGMELVLPGRGRVHRELPGRAARTAAAARVCTGCSPSVILQAAPPSSPLSTRRPRLPGDR